MSELSAKQRTQRLGRELVSKTALVLKLAMVHDMSNEAVLRPLRDLVSLINGAFDDRDSVRLQSIGDNFFLAGEPLRLTGASFDRGRELRECYERVFIHEVRFRERLNEAELRDFIVSFQQHLRGSTPEAFRQIDFGKISVRSIESASGSADGDIDERRKVMRAYALLTVYLRRAIESLEDGVPLRVAKIRRAIQSLAEASDGHESLLAGLTCIHPEPGDPAQHLATVTSLAMLTARRVGLPRSEMMELCMSAAFHDVGRRHIDLDQDDEVISWHMARVPLQSMLAICSGRLSEAALCRASVAYEHSLHYGEGEQGPAAQLIAVICAYDQLTSAPEGSHRALQPDEALRTLVDGGGRHYDAQMTRLFASTMGLFPVGCTVQLSTGELAIVIEVGDDSAHFARPSVKVIRDAHGSPTDYILDLSRQPGVSIVSSVEPTSVEINVPQFLLA